MRKTVLLFFACFIVSTSFGQLTQGTWLVGGNGMYSKRKNKSEGSLSYTTRDLTVLPNLAYFVIDNLATGLSLRGNFVKDSYAQPDGTKTVSVQQSIGAGPFVRYYFLNAESKANVFSSASALYTVNTSISTAAKSKQLDYTLGGGAELFFNSAVGLECLLEYKHSNGLDADLDWSASGIQFRVGLQFHLERTNR
jgi:hypothetical protein